MVVGFFSCCFSPSLLVAVSLWALADQGAWWHYGIFDWRRLSPGNSCCFPAAWSQDMQRNLGKSMQPKSNSSYNMAHVAKGLVGHFPIVWLGTHRARERLPLLPDKLWDNCQISFSLLFPLVFPLSSPAGDLPSRIGQGGPPCSCSSPHAFPHRQTTHQLRKPGYTSLPIRSPHLQQTPPCFPSVLTTLSNCCGKAEADLQHLLLLGLVGKQRDRGREEAQSPSTPASNGLRLQRAYRFQDTKYFTVYCMRSYKRLLHLQTSPFPPVGQQTL